jgi:hypothetical protein
MNIMERFPYACGFQYGSGGRYTLLKDGTSRPMTDLEWEWVMYEPESSIEILEQHDKANVDVPRCEQCDQFHQALAPAPVRTMYAEGPQPQPVLCPPCTDGWNEHWDAMWDEVYSSRYW